MHISTKKLYILLRTVVIFVLICGGIIDSRAFDTGLYTESSLLSRGSTVVRAGVEEAGIYLVPTQRLRSLGFNDPSKVRVFGYGGGRLAHVMTA